MKKMNCSVLVIVVFFMLYFPPVLSINPLYILTVISALYLIMIGIFKKIVISKISIKILLILSILIIFEIIVSSVNNLYSVKAISDLLLMLFGFVFVSIAIRNYCIIHRVSNKDLFFVLITAGVVQAILSLAAYLVPDFQAWFINKMIAYGYEASRFSQIATFRWYGVATQLGFATPVVQATIALMCIKYGLHKSLKFYFPAILLIFSAVINARLSAIILIGGIAIIIFDEFYKKITKKKLIRILLSFGLAVIAIGVILGIMRKYSYSNYNWIVGGLKSFLGIETDLEGIYPLGNYFSDVGNYRLPDGLHIMTGYGQDLHSVDLGYITDIGFIIDIWRYGIIVSLTLYIFIFCSLKEIKQITNYYYIYISLLIVFLFFACNLKGNVISATPISALYFFLLCAFPDNRRRYALKN